MQFFTVEPLGPQQSLTPEGFLVCHDVPIARTGVMEYAAIDQTHGRFFPEKAHTG